MPLINKYKIINFKYGKGSERILSNRTMELYGENLQVEAENTAGKTMSIQTIIQSICPLANVAKPFTAIYNKKEPLYSMIEWKLDDDKTLLLTGIGFEKKAGIASEDGKDKKDDLYKYFMFTIEESPEIGIDIDSIQLLKNNDKGKKVVQSLVNTEEYIKKLRDKHGKSKVCYFNSNSKKQYREKLAEYGINQSEWKEIIIKLNSDNKEGGLSDFVKEYNTSEKLIRDKIVPLIETSLSTEEGTPILKIKEQVKKCINNIIDMKDKLLDYDNYLYLNKKIEELKNKLNEILEKGEEKDIVLDELASLYMYIENKRNELNEEIVQYEKQEISKKLELKQVEYEEASYECNIINKEISEYESELNNVVEKISYEKDKLSLNNQHLNILKYKNKKLELEEEQEIKIRKENEKVLREKSHKEIIESLNKLGSTIHFCLKEKINESINDLEQNKDECREYEEKKKNFEIEKNRLTNLLVDENSKKKLFKSLEVDFEKEIHDYKKNNPDINNFISTNFLGDVIDFDKYINSIENQRDKVEDNILLETKKIDNLYKEIEKIGEIISSLTLNNQEKSKKLEELKNRKKLIDSFIEEYMNIKTKFEISDELESSAKLILELKKELNKLALQTKDLEGDKKELENKLYDLENYKDIIFEEETLLELDKTGIKAIEGIKYLLSLEGDINYKNKLISKNPLLPYSIIITNKEYQKLKTINLENKTKISTPILIREDIESDIVSSQNNLVISDKLNVLSNFDKSSLDAQKREFDINKLKDYIKKIQSKLDDSKFEKNMLDEFIIKTNGINFDASDLNIENEIKKREEELLNLSYEIKSKTSEKNRHNDKIKELIQNKESLLESKNYYFNKLKDLEKLKDKYEIIVENKTEIVKLTTHIEEIKREKEKLDKKTTYIELNIKEANHKGYIISENIKSLSNKINSFKAYNAKKLIDLSLNELEIKYDEYSKNPTEREIQDLNEEISRCIKKVENYSYELDEYKASITIDSYENIVISDTQKELKNKISINNKIIDELNADREKIQGMISEKNGELKSKKTDIFRRFEGQEPLETKFIKDFEFNKRKKEIKKDLKDILEIISDNVNNAKKLDDELRDLQKYKIQGKAIIYQPQNVFTESKRLQNKLQIIKEEIDKSIKQYEEMISKLKEFNYKYQENYSNIVECLNVNKDAYNRQIEQVEIVLLVIREEISKVEKHSEQLKKEKNIIIRQIKDYIMDCVEEFRIINKLGRHKGQSLFNINLPKQDKIDNNLNLVDILIDEIIEDANLSDVEQKINTFYILNRILNIGRIPISVIKYEINRNEIVKWNNINNETTGGQRFCISFIITILLMEYKRYDRKAIIDHSKYKGKVLLMDNPFGETSQQDFLQEIFDLAKKFRVQIISYTHVTNSSIRAMFNKIYLMTVEKTTSNKEFVDINEVKQSKVDESVYIDKFNIGKEEEVIQENLFNLI